MNKAAVKLIVSGFVQGVGFRYYCAREAASLGLTGWVKNCPDGTVECEAHGDQDHLNTFVATLERGPSNSRVEKVEQRSTRYLAQYSSFEIRH